AVQLGLQRYRVMGARQPVDPEAAAALPPVVVGLACRTKACAVLEPFAPDAVVGVVAQLPSVAEAAGPLVKRSSAGGDQAALRLLRALGDDVDDAVDRIGTIDGCSRPPDHLDALHVLEQQVLGVPEDAGEQGVVNAPPVNLDLQLGGEAIVEATGADGP